MKPTRYELIDKDGRKNGVGDKGDMIDLAHALWPGQPQDSGDGPEPEGWSLQIVGGETIYQRNALGPVKVIP